MSVRPSRIAIVALSLLLATCTSDSGVAPPLDDLDVEFAIGDGANDGLVDGFYWLSPTVKKSQKNFSYPFDPNFLSLNPTIQICKINGNTGDGFEACDGYPSYTAIRTLSGTSQPEIIRVDTDKENYSVTWQSTNGGDIQVGMTYRAVLSVGGVVLGWVDLEAVAKQKDLKDVTAGFSGFVVDNNFIFKWRVETGIPGSVVVTPASAVIKDDETQVYTATVSDLYANPLAGVTVDWTIDDATVASLAPTSGTTNGAGQTTTTATPTPAGTLNTPATITATSQGSSGTATIEVEPSEVGPDAKDDGFTATGGVTLNGDLTADNSSGADDLGVPTATVVSFGAGDINGGGTAVADFTPGDMPSLAGGTLDVNANGTFSLTGITLLGTFTFDYKLDNGIGNSVATVTIMVEAFDFGDAPDPTYPTLLASNGARHQLGSGLLLGAAVDFEADGQPTSDATGDDVGPPLDDEDGVTFTSALVQDMSTTVDVTASAAGLLNAWVDFNDDGDWGDSGEQIFTDVALAAGTNSLNFSVPATATLGNTFARFRFDTSGGLAPTGLASDGEVEDYQVEVVDAVPVDAVNDDYTASGNIEIGIAANGVLGNDTPPVGLTVVAVQGSGANVGVRTATTAVGVGGVTGFVTLAADGSFTYEPPPGYKGADTFGYTASNGTTDDATVTVTVSDMVWFIDTSVTGPGTGTFTDPFKTIASFNAINTGAAPNAQPGDLISLASGAYSETDGINLRDNQVLIGEGVAFGPAASTAAGFTADPNSVTAYFTFASTAGTAPTIAASAGNGIDLGSGNTIRGLNVGNTSGIGIASGFGFGTLNVSDVSIMGTGQALDLSLGILNATFGELSSSSGVRGIDLDGVSGSLTHSTGSISGNSAEAVRLNQTSLSFAYSGGITNSANGIVLTGNSGATMNFSGTLSLSTGANAAFTATGGGTVSATGTGSTVTNGAATAVNINATAIGTSGVTFQSVSSNGGAKGIVLTNAGSGGFTVTGTSTTDGTGGTIQNKTARGVEVIGTDGVSISNMALTSASTTNGADPTNSLSTCSGTNNSGCNAAIHLNDVTGALFNNVDISGSTAQQGINGLNVTGFTLGVGSSITGAGNQVNEGGVRLFNLDGTVLVNGVVINTSAERNFFITNNFGSMKTLTMTVQNSNMDNTGATFGADGLEIELLNNTTMDLDVTGSVFSGNRTNGIQVIAAGNSIANSVDITGNNIDPGTGVGLAINLNTNNTGTMNFNVTGNTKLWSDGGTAVNVTAFVNSTMSGRINSNTDIRTDVIAANPQSGGSGIRVAAEDASDIVIEIDGNTISNIFQDDGIMVLSRSGVSGTAGRLDATINNNNVTLQAGLAFPLYGIETRAQDFNTICANVTNNSVTVGNGVADFRVRESAATSTVLLQGFNTNAATTWTGNGNTGAVVSESPAGAASGGTCTPVTHPVP